MEADGATGVRNRLGRELGYSAKRRGTGKRKGGLQSRATIDRDWKRKTQDQARARGNIIQVKKDRKRKRFCLKTTYPLIKKSWKKGLKTQNARISMRRKDQKRICRSSPERNDIRPKKGRWYKEGGCIQGGNTQHHQA